MLLHYHYSCQGESHKASGKPCQDYSYSSTSDVGTTIAIVCDGHGGERYFRSDIGSRFATEVIHDAVNSFVSTIDKSMFKGKPYTAIGIASSDDDRKQTPLDNAFRQLFSSIIYQWNNRITEHAKATPLTEWELQNVPQKYLDEFKQAETFEKTYGCTLMTYVQTPDYWFAFHLGDGKCIAFQDTPFWYEPIPWDDRCFLNKTTSICDSDAINEFRYCYQGDGDFPYAVFLGSDGIDDSFGEDDNLVNFYIQVVKLLVNDGFDYTIQSIVNELPQLSKIGSKDDMSLSFVANYNLLKSYLDSFILYQINKVKEDLSVIDKKLKTLYAKLYNLENDNSEKGIIETSYTIKDIDKHNNLRFSLLYKFDLLMKQYSIALSKKLRY